jgi:molecular chaperone GrpE
MKEKDINIEDEETVVENTEAAEAASDPSVSSDPSDSSVSSDPEAPEAEEKSPLEQAQDEIAELKDKYLRSVAEFDNYRKRTLKERAELILNGGEKVLTAILPVVDDMERAIENGAKTDDPQVLREGMEIIYHKLLKVIEAQGVTVIDTNDADFDTDIHEAVAMVPGMGDDKKGKVIDCLQKGYKLNDKVIRHAKVAVGQ